AGDELREYLHGRHVDLIEIRPLFPIDFDTDEVVVENSGDLRIFEALVLHHVTPVTGRVADAEKDRPIQLLGPRQCLRSPWIPGNRVIGMLLQVWAGFMQQRVGLLGCLAHGGFSPGAYFFSRFQTWKMCPLPSFELNSFGRSLPGGAKQTLCVSPSM